MRYDVDYHHGFCVVIVIVNTNVIVQLYIYSCYCNYCVLNIISMSQNDHNLLDLNCGSRLLICEALPGDQRTWSLRLNGQPNGYILFRIFNISISS